MVRKIYYQEEKFMLRFENDYLEGCLPGLLDRLVKTNMEQTAGYRLDEYCDSATEKIRQACKSNDLDVHYFVGGTQANLTVLSSIMRPHEGVISPVLGHVNIHECGAIEGIGHKVITVSNGDEVLDNEAKLYPTSLDKYLSNFFGHWDWHRAQPGAVYISHPTERGVLYTRQELIEIKTICDRFNLPLFVDGARLSYALASEENDISLEDLARYSDVFYIGGTKCGAMFGEAVCFTNDKYNKGFACLSKSKGAIMAKGRLLGVQFEYLFTDDIYTKSSIEACKYALEIREAFLNKNIKFLSNSYTNQQFPILTKEQQKVFDDRGISYTTESYEDDNSNGLRFCTSWASKREDIDYLLETIASL